MSQKLQICQAPTVFTFFLFFFTVIVASAVVEI